MIAFHLSIGNSSIGATCWTPALLTAARTVVPAARSRTAPTPSRPAFTSALPTTAASATSAGVFTEANLKRYRSVVFLNTAGDVLSDAEQTAWAV